MQSQKVKADVDWVTATFEDWFAEEHLAYVAVAHAALVLSSIATSTSSRMGGIV